MPARASALQSGVNTGSSHRHLPLTCPGAEPGQPGITGHDAGGARGAGGDCDSGGRPWHTYLPRVHCHIRRWYYAAHRDQGMAGPRWWASGVCSHSCPICRVGARPRLPGTIRCGGRLRPLCPCQTVSGFSGCPTHQLPTCSPGHQDSQDSDYTNSAPGAHGPRWPPSPGQWPSARALR